MNGDPKARIEAIIQEGYDFKFGEYISRGFDLLQKNLGGFILYTLVYLAIVMVVQFIPFIGPVAVQFFISPALTVGFFLVAHKLDRGETAEFGDFFRGFDYIGQLALTSLVMTVIIIASIIPFFLAVAGSGLFEWYMDAMQMKTEIGDLPQMPGWAFLLLLPAIYLGIAYYWAYMFVVFHNLTFWEALESSRKLITKHWFIIFAFLLVTGLIMLAGAILLCIGILASLPAGMCMIYAAFADVTRLNAEPSSGDDIERHLVD
ncbi:MAG: hypothetical protein H6577_05095 [Lewinellaceae bacterium]|nr:hypothetical protein [Saprospiraceae bacterium]MCB9337481.1 hypothetical protein [Lewinellaceae bacterium]